MQQVATMQVAEALTVVARHDDQRAFQHASPFKHRKQCAHGAIGVVQSVSVLGLRIDAWVRCPVARRSSIGMVSGHVHVFEVKRLFPFVEPFVDQTDRVFLARPPGMNRVLRGASKVSCKILKPVVIPLLQEHIAALHV